MQSGGILLVNDLVVVPSSLRSRMLKQLHAAHPGVRRMKALVRCYLYWPGLTGDIENLLKVCDHCISQVGGHPAGRLHP